MEGIINWFNENNGFATTILSAIGLLLSVIVILVSIRTAKIPYKKKVKLSYSTDTIFEKNTFTGCVRNEVIGLSVNVTNIGPQNICITYLGLSVKYNNKRHKISKIYDEITGTGLLAPSEIKTEFYNKDDLLQCLKKINHKSKFYVCASDTEGTEYYKYICNVGDILKTLSM